MQTFYHRKVSYYSFFILDKWWNKTSYYWWQSLKELRHWSKDSLSLTAFIVRLDFAVTVYMTPLFTQPGYTIETIVSNLGILVNHLHEKKFLTFENNPFSDGITWKRWFLKKERKEKDFLDLFKRQQNILSSSQKRSLINSDLIRLNIFFWHQFLLKECYNSNIDWYFVYIQNYKNIEVNVY